MDALNPDTWKHLWGAVLSTPYIMMPPIAIAAGWVGWWLRGIKSEGKIAGLEAESKLADRRAAWASEVRDDIARQFKEFKEAEASRAGNDALIARIERLEAAVLSAVTGILDATEGADTANFHGKIKRSWPRFLSDIWSKIWRGH